MKSAASDELIKLSLFVEMSKAISQTTNVKETLKEVMRQIGLIFAPQNWSLLLRDIKTGDLEFIICQGEKSECLRNTLIKKGEGIAGSIADNGEPLIIKNVYSDKRFAKRFDAVTGFKTQSIIGVPLKTDGDVYGVIELINRLDGESFSDFDLKVLTTIADFAAIAIEKSYYLDTVKKIAMKDDISGAFSRSYFEKSIKQEIERSKRYRNHLSIMIVDVDNFTEISEQHGRKAGEKVLRHLALLLQKHIRNVDKVFRLGYNEMVILMPDTGKNQAVEIKNRIGMNLFQAQSKKQTVPYNISYIVASNNKGDCTEIIDTLNAIPEANKAEKKAPPPDHPENMAENIKDLLNEMF